MDFAHQRLWLKIFFPEIITLKHLILKLRIIGEKSKLFNNAVNQTYITRSYGILDVI